MRPRPQRRSRRRRRGDHVMRGATCFRSTLKFGPETIQGSEGTSIHTLAIISSSTLSCVAFVAITVMRSACAVTPSLTKSPSVKFLSPFISKPSKL